MHFQKHQMFWKWHRDTVLHFCGESTYKWLTDSFLIIVDLGLRIEAVIWKYFLRWISVALSCICMEVSVIWIFVLNFNIVFLNWLLERVWIPHFPWRIFKTHGTSPFHKRLLYGGIKRVLREYRNALLYKSETYLVDKVYRNTNRTTSKQTGCNLVT